MRAAAGSGRNPRSMAEKAAPPRAGVIWRGSVVYMRRPPNLHGGWTLRACCLWQQQLVWRFTCLAVLEVLGQ